MILAIILISIQVVLFFVDLSLSAVHFTGNTAGAIINKGADFTASKLGVEVNDRLKETLRKTAKFTFNTSIKTVKVIIHITQFILGIGVFCALLIAFFLSIMLTMAPAVLGGGALITIIAQSKDYAELAQDLGIANILEDPNYEGAVDEVSDIVSGESSDSEESKNDEDANTSTASASSPPIQNDGSVLGKLQTMAVWYKENIGYYNKSHSDLHPCPLTAPYGKQAVCPDCSGFAAAYMCYVAQVNVSDAHSSTFGQAGKVAGKWKFHS